MSGNGETFCSGRQFLISYKGVNRVVDNVLIQRLVLYFRNLHLFHSNTIKTYATFWSEVHFKPMTNL